MPNLYLDEDEAWERICRAADEEADRLVFELHEQQLEHQLAEFDKLLAQAKKDCAEYLREAA